MTLFSFTITFTLVWWLVLFMALPFGVKTGDVEKGHDSGAPKKTYLGRKLVITTILALALTYGILSLGSSGIIDVDKLIGRG